MNITFFDQEDQASVLNGIVISDHSRLFQILSNMQDRPPFICELVGENGYCLLVGIGNVGWVQHSRCDGKLPYLVAVARKGEQGAVYHEFLCGGTPTPIHARYCMPFDEVMEIVSYFQETGEAYPGISWQEI
jgi:hypothetical protein